MRRCSLNARRTAVVISAPVVIRRSTRRPVEHLARRSAPAARRRWLRSHRAGRARRTATATCGSPGRAGEADDPGVRPRRVVPSWAVPVLPPTSSPGCCSRGAGAVLRRRRSSPAASSAASRADGCPSTGSGRARRSTLPLLSRISFITWGFMIMPPLATPAATSAISSGVACTSFCPIDDWAELREVVREVRSGRPTGRRRAGRSAACR